MTVLGYRMLKIAALFAVLLAFTAGCAAAPVAEVPTLWLTPSLSAREAQAVIDGLDRWTTATGGEVSFAVAYGTPADYVPGKLIPGVIVVTREDVASFVDVDNLGPGFDDHGITIGSTGRRAGQVKLCGWDDTATDAQLAGLVVHELGHALGLLHVTEGVSVMYADAALDAPEISPSDVTAVLATY